MNQPTYLVPQSDPPLSPRLTLPTMYDLPSEDPKEPGLPDEYHALQPQLLSRTFRSPCYPPDRIFTGFDLNLYYDSHHPRWHKRPDWFAAVDVPRLYGGTELRRSYVVWQESVNPFVVVELLSPGTEKEDLGEEMDAELNPNGNAEPEAEPDADPAIAPQTNGQSPKELPPGKWEVYEKLLRIPYYIVFSRYTDRLRCFQLVGGRYQEVDLDPQNPRLWIPALDLGIGLWLGEFQGISRKWLRWYDAQDNWVPTDTEQEQMKAEEERLRAEQERLRAEQERLRAEQERLRAEQERQAKESALNRAQEAENRLKQVALNLLQTNMSVEQIAQLIGVSVEQVRELVDDGK